MEVVEQNQAQVQEDTNVEFTEEEISLDSKQSEMFTLIGDNVLLQIVTKLQRNPEGVREMCISSNNSRPIADYKEQLTADSLTRFFLNSNEYESDVYMSGNEGRTDHDRVIYKTDSQYCVCHLVNQTIKPDLVICLHFNGTASKELTPDQHFHMKCSQSNLSGFSSTIDGGPVTYNGLIPKDVTIPHFTFILKHIYSEDHGIHKIVLIAVPHCSIQNKHFPDIQKNGERVRIAKAKDEFRFNMNDSEGNPYTFLGTDTPRYRVFDILPHINYA